MKVRRPLFVTSDVTLWSFLQRWTFADSFGLEPARIARIGAGFELHHALKAASMPITTISIRGSSAFAFSSRHFLS